MVKRRIRKGKAVSNDPIVVKKSRGIAEIYLNRSDSLNAIDRDMGEQLWNALEDCERDNDVKVVVVKGIGRAFCAGGDIKGMKDSLNSNPNRFLKELTRPVHGAIVAIRNLSKPVIAQVNGPAYGAGFGLVLACDLVIASDKAIFCQAFANIGATPDSSSTFFLPRLVGLQKASEIFFFAKMIGAEEGYQLGFVNRVVPEGKIDEITQELAMKLAKGPSMVYSKIKRLINSGILQTIETQLEDERQLVSESGTTEDFKEGVRAFFEKRQPEFKGE
jgi:2-(1,2-epoxy-1,2-dihydrophenyl)acetyl-CoA isomerase